MAHKSVFNRLSSSLEALLKKELPNGLVDTFLFDAPGGQDSGKTLNLFLYDIRENRELRNNELHVDWQNGIPSRRLPPIRIDCSYLITATAGNADDGIGSEHSILGEVMKVLLRHSTLPFAIVDEELGRTGLALPVASLQPGRLQSIGEYWQAIGGKPKAVLHYTVTIAVDAHELIPAGEPVTDKRLKFKSGTVETDS